MDEYTPTTEEIRDYFEVGGEPRAWEAPDAEKDARRAAAFDRWLRAHDATIWDEGAKATDRYYWRCEDADAAGQGVMIFRPKNPYRITEENN